MAQLVTSVTVRDIHRNLTTQVFTEGETHRVVCEIAAALEAEGFTVEHWMSYKSMFGFDAVSAVQTLRVEVLYRTIQPVSTAVEFIISNDVI